MLRVRLLVVLGVALVGLVGFSVALFGSSVALLRVLVALLGAAAALVCGLSVACALLRPLDQGKSPAELVTGLDELRLPIAAKLAEACRDRRGRQVAADAELLGASGFAVQDRPNSLDRGHARRNASATWPTRKPWTLDF